MPTRRHEPLLFWVAVYNIEQLHFCCVFCLKWFYWWEKQSNSSNTYLFIKYLHFCLEGRCFSFRTPSVVHLVCHHFSRGTDNRDQIISLHVIDLNGDGPNISFFSTLYKVLPFFLFYLRYILSVNHGTDGSSWSRMQNINLKVYFISELCVLLNLWPVTLAVLIVPY